MWPSEFTVNVGLTGNLLPAEGLVTSSEDYYPTVAINALMRVLRDPTMASQHQAVGAAVGSVIIFSLLGIAEQIGYLLELVVQSWHVPALQVVTALMSIFKALGVSSVPYLPKVLPVLFAVLRISGDNLLREYILDRLTMLTRVRVRAWLGRQRVMSCQGAKAPL